MMLQANTYYHVFNHANGFEELFFEERNYSFFLRKYRKFISPIADTPVWCLMPNHFHILIRVKTEEQLLKVYKRFKSYHELLEAKVLSKAFANFFSSYSQSMNKVYKRRGSMFVKSFKRKEIDSPAYLRTIILYIHLNPVKHRIRQTPNAWAWSSIHGFAENEKPLLIDVFGSIEAYYQAHKLRIKDLLHHLDETYTLEIMYD